MFLSTVEESSGHPDDFTTADLLRRLEKIILDNGALSQVPAGHMFWRGRLTDDPRKVAEYNIAS
ncbi:MAG: hypothetical protein ACRDQ5_07095, partial [Sciscionella sp.]